MSFIKALIKLTGFFEIKVETTDLQIYALNYAEATSFQMYEQNKNWAVSQSSVLAEVSNRCVVVGNLKNMTTLICHNMTRRDMG